MRNQYMVHTGGFDWPRLKDETPEMTDIILRHAGFRIELTWHDNYWPLPDELRPPGMPAHEQYNPIYEQKLVIERSRGSLFRHGPRDSLTVTFSEGWDRRLNTPHFQYAELHGWPYDQEAVFAATDHTRTWTDVRKIRLPIGRGDPNSYHRTTNQVQLVLQDRAKILDRFNLTNGLRRDLIERLTQGLQLRHALVGGVDQYVV